MFPVPGSRFQVPGSGTICELVTRNSEWELALLPSMWTCPRCGRGFANRNQSTRVDATI